MKDVILSRQPKSKERSFLDVMYGKIKNYMMIVGARSY